MYSIAAPIMNKIANESSLKTPLAKRLFPMKQDRLHQALDAMESKLTKEGLPMKVATALMSVGPFLWEKKAIADFVRKNPTYLDTLPDLASVPEAVIMATKEFSLNESQQKLLAEQLQNPPT